MSELRPFENHATKIIPLPNPAYSKNVGTLVFTGYGESPKVYIINANSDWNTVSSETSEKYLDSFQNPGSDSFYIGFAVVEHEDKIYLIGGISDSIIFNTIQVVSFANVETLHEAQSRQWTFMETLRNHVFHARVGGGTNFTLVNIFVYMCTQLSHMSYLDGQINNTCYTQVKSCV